jgi:hypothetical protein
MALQLALRRLSNYTSHICIKTPLKRVIIICCCLRAHNPHERNAQLFITTHQVGIKCLMEWLCGCGSEVRISLKIMKILCSRVITRERAFTERMQVSLIFMCSSSSFLQPFDFHKKSPPTIARRSHVVKTREVLIKM